MKKINNFINQYPLSKTLRFSLIPIGKTEENFKAAQLLENDKDRAEKYAKVKKYIDRYHKHFINDVLSNVKLDELTEYAELYFKSGKTDKELNTMSALEAKMRKSIASSFTKDSRYSSLNKKELIEKILPEFLTSEEEKSDVESFFGFTTYFTGFNENRQNMYSAEAQTTAISHRCINENLPRFLDNIKKFDIVKEALSEDSLKELDDMTYKNTGFYIQDIFTVDYFNLSLSQSGIDDYNNILGGYVDDNGNKIKGLNEYINLYNQQVAGKDKHMRLPLFTPLYKQILSDRESISFIPEKFSGDNALLAAINDFHLNVLSKHLNETKELFDNISSYNFSGIFVASSGINELSNGVFGRWDAVSEGWREEYKINQPPKKNKNPEKYEDDMRKAYKKKLSFSLSETENLGQKFKTDNCIGDIAKYLQNTVTDNVNWVNECYTEAESLLTSDYQKDYDKKLLKNTKAKELIKNYLDSVKVLEHILKLLKGDGKEENKDFSFYGKFTECYEAITEVDGLYDKTRNYLTQKPYSNNKIKLNFENSSFLSGWAQSYETKGAIIFKDTKNYYIGIVNKKLPADDLKKLTENADDSDFERIVYDFQKPDNKNTPRLFIRSKGDTFAPSVKQLNLPINDIINIYDCGYFKTEYRKKDEETYKKSLIKMIDYFKLGFSKHDSYKHYSFKWKNSNEYKDISEFYKDTIESCYELHFEKVNYTHIEDLINRGKLYLFKIYNKDFSPKSHGKPNLHTMYFKMLFDEKNLKDVVYQLNGGAEMFYREASIKKDERIIHYAHEELENKNKLNSKKYSSFEYDIIKDKRYTKDQFSLHLPITLNFKAAGNNYINTDVRAAIKNTENNYVIGIDRGERNLLYICVVDEKGNIVEQKSLNEVISDNNYKVDYHRLLDDKETYRDKARKDWDTIKNIKELKEGYLSQVVHQICEYVIKYDAVIAMEDLNFGFKKGRFNVEKQVYQKFENALSTKLNYLVLKDETPENPGGLLKAYQLTNKMNGVNTGRQNGIIFYVPAWLTSKIDPVTGFVDLLKPRYASVNASLEFISKIDDIRFNHDENLFEFDIDYSKFPKTNASYKKQWTICTNGERIINIKNKEKNNMWDNQTIVLTDEFKNLFNKYNIDISENIKENILKITDSNFHKEFMKLLSYTLQMRNSVTNNVDIDYLISPVKDSNGVFYDSRNQAESLPENADANGAYNIARKALWAISVLKDTDDEELKTANLSIQNSQWLEYVQK